MIGDVALVYDWCFDSVTRVAAARAGSRTRTRRCGTCGTTTEAKWGSNALPVERLVDRRPVEQLLLLVPARDDAARPRDQGREPAGRRRGSRSSATPRCSASSCRRSTRSLRGGGSREGTALRRLDARPVRPLRHVAGDDRREAAGQDQARAPVDALVHAPGRCRRSTASRRPAISRATRRRRCSTTSATTSRS